MLRTYPPRMKLLAKPYGSWSWARQKPRSKHIQGPYVATAPPPKPTFLPFGGDTLRLGPFSTQSPLPASSVDIDTSWFAGLTSKGLTRPCPSLSASCCEAARTISGVRWAGSQVDCWAATALSEPDMQYSYRSVLMAERLWGSRSSTCALRRPTVLMERVRRCCVLCVAAAIGAATPLCTGEGEGEREGKDRVVRPVSWR